MIRRLCAAACVANVVLACWLVAKILLVLWFLLFTGCQGMLIDSLERRGANSCIWWNSALTGLRSVSATGGVDIRECLNVPCQGR